MSSPVNARGDQRSRTRSRWGVRDGVGWYRTRCKLLIGVSVGAPSSLPRGWPGPFVSPAAQQGKSAVRLRSAGPNVQSVHFVHCTNRACQGPARVAYCRCGAASARCILGRFLPKLGGAERCRHLFWGVAKSIVWYNHVLGRRPTCKAGPNLSHHTALHRLVRPGVRMLATTPIRPNHVTAFRIVMAIAAMPCIAMARRGRWRSAPCCS